MSLPNLAHVAGGWAEVVALSPVLNIFEGSEVELLNDIPEYDGVSGLIGSLLTIVFLAIGAVRKIYQTNEESEEMSKRSVTPARWSHDPQWYFKMAQALDKNSCATLLLCILEFQAQSGLLKKDEAELMAIFGSDPQPLPISERANAEFEFRYAIYIGSSAKSQRTCTNTFSRCPYQVSHLMAALKWINHLPIADLKNRPKPIK